MQLKRVLLKLSGESLASADNYGIDAAKLSLYTNEIKTLVDAGVQVGIVIGGGNIFRGVKGNSTGVDRVQGDYMGMLATIINGLAIQSGLENSGIKSKVLSGIAISHLCEPMSRRTAINYLESGYVVIVSGGTGNPFFTTDTAAALRAIEIKADVILKGTRVDGIYTADPEKDKSATKFDTLTFDEAYSKQLNIMDLTAFTLCKENNMPVIVFDINKSGNLQKLISGEKIGTLVTVK